MLPVFNNIQYGNPQKSKHKKLGIRVLGRQFWSTFQALSMWILEHSKHILEDLNKYN